MDAAEAFRVALERAKQAENWKELAEKSGINPDASIRDWMS